MKRFALQFCLIIVAIFAVRPSSAFWVYFTGHEQITRAGLGDVGSILPVHEIGFSIEAVEAIVKSNENTDKPSINPYSPLQHFDNEQFRAGAAHSIRLRTLIVNALMKGDRAEAWRRLGRALHGIQDFYAHSSWIERHRNAQEQNAESVVASHFDVHELNDGDRLRRFMREMGDFHTAGCGADGKTLNSSPAITSGYYPQTTFFDPFSEDEDLPWPSPSANPTKCVHLGATVWVSCSPGSVIPACRALGFEKDDPDDDLHLEASDAARRATWLFVQDIVTELEGLQQIEANLAVCHLFGQPLRLCAVPPSGLSDGAFRLTAVCVYSIPSYFRRESVSNTGVRSTLSESDQTQHVCIEASDTVVDPSAIFCRKDGAWIPKVSTVGNPGSNQQTVRRTLSVSEDGTFHASYVRVSRSPPGSVGKSADDFTYDVRVNATTHRHFASLYKLDYTSNPSNGSLSSEWNGMGVSTLPSPAAGYGITLLRHASFEPEKPLPSYCSQ